MKKTSFKYLSLIGLLLGALSCNHRQKKADESLLVYSGAGLTDVITELKDSFQLKYNIKVNLNLASSGTLARQIEHGAEPDIYISASMRWANYVAELGYIVDSMVQDVCYNNIVLIAPEDSELDSLVIDSTLDISNILEGKYLAIGNPAHVPVGRYAKQSLDYYQQYDILLPYLLMAKDTRSALMTVEMGEAALGIVYYTDALRSNKVKIVAILPEESHTKIKYVASLCKDEALSHSFFSYIGSEETQWIWSKHGFNK